MHASLNEKIKGRLKYIKKWNNKHNQITTIIIETVWQQTHILTAGSVIFTFDFNLFRNHSNAFSMFTRSKKTQHQKYCEF